MAKWTLAPRTLFHFEYFALAERMLVRVHFRDDKFGDGPRTLFRFGNSAMPKWTLVSVHFFISEVARRQNGCWSLNT